MPTSFGALCTDFYVNQKLALKMDLPSERETILHFFDQLKKTDPSMNRFRRYDGELVLESSRRESAYRWTGMRRNSLRAGAVNPETMDEAYTFHRQILKVAPYHLTVSPLDIDHLELLFGFDLDCKGNQDEVVYRALYEGSPAARLLNLSVDGEDCKVLDVQPVFGCVLTDAGDLQAYFEVKTRPKSRRGSSRQYRHEPINIFITLRKYGPIDEVDDLIGHFNTMAKHCEALTTEKLVPDLLQPIARHITSGSA